jgi:hypothetical protein
MDHISRKEKKINKLEILLYKKLTEILFSLMKSFYNIFKEIHKMFK